MQCWQVQAQHGDINNLLWTSNKANKSMTAFELDIQKFARFHFNWQPCGTQHGRVCNGLHCSKQ